MTLGILVIIVGLCDEVAQDRLRVSESYAVVLVVGWGIAQTEGEIFAPILLVIGDVAPVVVLVFVLTESSVGTDADVASVATRNSRRTEPWTTPQTSVQQEVTAEVVIVAVAPVRGFVEVHLDIIADEVMLTERVFHVILVRIIIECG